MSIGFALSFKLKMRKVVLTSMLFFKVSCNRIYNNRHSEGFNMPIISEYLKTRAVDVSKVVHIPPFYPWHFRKNKYDPCVGTGIIEVAVNDGYSYHLHVYARPVDFSESKEDSWNGTNAASNIPSITKLESMSSASSSEITTKYVSLIVDDLIKRANGHLLHRNVLYGR